MKLKGLLAKLSDEQVPGLNDFIYDRVADFRPDSEKEKEIRERINVLREKIPDDVFLDLDEAYVELMVASNMELFKKGFHECLQLILSAADTPSFEQKGEEY